MTINLLVNFNKKLNTSHNRKHKNNQKFKYQIIIKRFPNQVKNAQQKTSKPVTH